LISQAAFALVNALVVGVGGCLSSLAGGRAADLVVQRSIPSNSKAARAWLVAASCSLAVPAWLAVIKAPTFTVAMATLIFDYAQDDCLAFDFS
jgi:hypothetical protein